MKKVDQSHSDGSRLGKQLHVPISCAPETGRAAYWRNTQLGPSLLLAVLACSYPGWASSPVPTVNSAALDHRETRFAAGVVAPGGKPSAPIKALAKPQVAVAAIAPPRLSMAVAPQESLSTLPGTVKQRRVRLLHHKFLTEPHASVREIPRYEVVVTTKASAAPAVQIRATAMQGTASLVAKSEPSPLPQTPQSRKVISVSALTLPPAGDPLPDWMRGATMAADAPLTQLPPSAPQPAATGTRVAQDFNAPPLRQPVTPVVNSDFTPSQIEVAASTFVVLLTTNDLQTVSIADPNIADVAVVNARAVLVNGKSPGITSLVLVDHQKIRQYQIRVVAAQGTRPNDVQAAINLPDVTVRQLKEAIVLEGSVATSDEEKRAVDIAGVFSTKVIDHLVVRNQPLTTTQMSIQDRAELVAQIQAAINVPTITVKSVGENVVLEGIAPTQSQRDRAETVARALGKNVSLLDLIQIPVLTVDQVRESLGTPANAEPAASDVPARNITVRQVGDEIILEGIAESAQEIDQAVQIAARTGLQVVNRLQLPAVIPVDEGALLALQHGIDRALGYIGVRVSGGKKRLVLTGIVHDTNDAVIAEQIARSFTDNVDIMLQTPNPQQINVDVTIAEVDKSKLDNLGVTFPTFGSSTTSPAGFVVGQNTGTTSVSTGGAGTTTTTLDAPGNITDHLFGTSFGVLSAIQASIRAIVQSGDGRLLSNPNTTVLSGRTATFQVGGQVPIPSSTTLTAAGATTSITFKDYGILIDVVPVVGTGGNVTMRVRTEVSLPDPTTGFTPPGGGSQIPGFTDRVAVTEVTVKPNDSLGLAGLIQDNKQYNVTGIPLLSKIPILGSLFTSKSFTNNRTELVIFVTPRALPSNLKPGTMAPVAPEADGNTTNSATVMSNPGIGAFNSGSVIAPAAANGGS